MAKEELICRPADITDILTIIFVNYVVHAVTVLTSPGCSGYAAADASLWALLVPYKGIIQGLRVLSKGAVFAWNDPLEKAARARALCCVYKEADDKNQIMASLEPSTYGDPQPPYKPKSRLRLANASIHGFVKLPPGYGLTPIPNFVEVKSLVQVDNREKEQGYYTTGELCCNYNAIKILASIVQVVSGGISLWRARGMQLHDYGYTAYNLTVIPYITMSIVNLLANLVCPDYPTLYVVETELLDELRRDYPDKAIVQGTVGRISSFMPRQRTGWERFLRTFLYFLGFTLMATPFIAVGLLTRFNPGPKSTTEERAWLTSWLITAVVFGPVIGWFSQNTYTHSLKKFWRTNKKILKSMQGGTTTVMDKVFTGSIALFFCIVWSILYISVWVMVFVCPIGMFMVVGKQIVKFGVCKTV